MLHDKIRVCALQHDSSSSSSDVATTTPSSSPTSACDNIQHELLFTPARKAAFLKPVMRATQGKRLRAGPLLPFLDDCSEEDVRRSLAQHDAEWTANAKKPKRKQSASF